MMTKYLEQRVIGALAWLAYAKSKDSVQNANEVLDLVRRVMERQPLQD